LAEPSFLRRTSIIIGRAVLTVDRSGVLHVFTRAALTLEGSERYSFSVGSVVPFVTPRAEPGVFVASGDHLLALGLS
jgi:hypothetical protein